jgi:hypothetical protein
MEIANLKRKDLETQEKIEFFDEKIKEIREGVFIYHRICQEEKQDFLLKIRENMKKKEEFEEFRKRLRFLEKIIFEFKALDSLDGTTSFLSKIQEFKEKLSEIEDFDKENSRQISLENRNEKDHGKFIENSRVLLENSREKRGLLENSRENLGFLESSKETLRERKPPQKKRLSLDPESRKLLY